MKVTRFRAVKNDRIVRVFSFDRLVAQGNLEHIQEYTAWNKQIFLDNCEEFVFYLKSKKVVKI